MGGCPRKTLANFGPSVLSMAFEPNLYGDDLRETSQSRFSAQRTTVHVADRHSGSRAMHAFQQRADDRGWGGEEDQGALHRNFSTFIVWGWEAVLDSSEQVRVLLSFCPLNPEP